MLSPERRQAEPPCHPQWGYLVGGSGNSVSDVGNTLMPIQSSTLSSSQVPVDVIYKGVTVRFPDEP